MEPIPVTGPQGCATMAARFGAEPGSWREIRFTHEGGTIPPGVLTTTSQGNTVTVTLSAEGTVDFTSQLPIEAVYVNKGTYPNDASAIYRYVPPVLADTNLGLLPVVLSGVDHIVLCWAVPAPTTVPATTTTVEVTPRSVVPGPTTTVVVLPTSVARTSVAAATTLTGTLPETGGSTSSTLLVAGLLLLAGAGVASMAVVRRDRS